MNLIQILKQLIEDEAAYIDGAIRSHTGELLCFRLEIAGLINEDGEHLQVMDPPFDNTGMEFKKPVTH